MPRRIRTPFGAIAWTVPFFVFAACATRPQARFLATDIPGVSRSGDSFALSAETLEREIAARMKRIREFAAIGEWGSRHGVRIWGAGGTATGLGVYVKQHLENEWRKARGLSPKYFEGRFTYEYFDVFRSTQDADIVIDGTEEDARRLEAFLKEKFASLHGSKEIWEVRLLRGVRGSGAGEKDPLLGFDFRNQNSDSFSTGMVELTSPPKGENPIRDLFDWENPKDPKFLTDLAKGEVSFYRNPRHFETKRAAKGINPEILSVIRAFTKAFQYESAIRPEDEAELRRIIEAWDPKAAVDSYVANQIAKNGQKLFWHSPDVERAWDELERIGLRRKLVRFGEIHRQRDLAIWLDREPLRTRPLGRTGRTADELKLDVVAHETNSFLAYENISRSLKGKPNAFISRRGATGEAAVHGDGFYTRIGRIGARATGLTIRFRLHPDAVEGEDFILVEDHDYVVIRNAASLTVIDESLNLTPMQYFHLLAKGEFSEADKGMLEKLKLKLGARLRELNPREEREVGVLVANAIRAGMPDEGERLPPLLEEWFATESARRHPALVEALLTTHFEPKAFRATRNLLTPEQKRRYFEKALLGKDEEFVCEFFLSQPELHSDARFVPTVERYLRAYGGAAPVAEHVLSRAELFSHPRFASWMEHALSADETALRAVARRVLANSALMDHPKFASWVDRVVVGEQTSGAPYVELLAHPGLAKHPKFPAWIERGIGLGTWVMAEYVLNQPHLIRHPDFGKWMGLMTAQGGRGMGELLRNPQVRAWPGYAKLVKGVLERSSDWSVVEFLRDETTRKHPRYGTWLALAFDPPALAPGVVKLFSVPEVRAHPRFSEWIERYFRRVDFKTLGTGADETMDFLRELARTDPARADRYAVRLLRGFAEVGPRHHLSYFGASFERYLEAERAKPILERLAGAKKPTFEALYRAIQERGVGRKCERLLEAYRGDPEP